MPCEKRNFLSFDVWEAAGLAGAAERYLHGSDGHNYGLGKLAVLPPNQVDYQWGHAGW